MNIRSNNVKLGFKSFTLSLTLYQELHPFTLAKKSLARHYIYLRTKQIQTRTKVIKKKKKKKKNKYTSNKD